jgi:hypothetical protein
MGHHAIAPTAFHNLPFPAAQHRHEVSSAIEVRSRSDSFHAKPAVDSWKQIKKAFFLRRRPS